MVNLEQAKKLINLARDSINSHFLKKEVRIPSDVRRDFSKNQGVFVTLNIDGKLRGCIGFPEPVYPLYDAIVQAVGSVAFSDPRFPPMDKKEFEKVVIEVSVLTVPHLIEVRNPEDILSNVKVGRDGLIVKGTFESGLLLPQVAVEYNWDSTTFLQQTCVKAGLDANAWQDFDNIRVYSFQSEVFKEQSPKGEVVKVL